MIVNGDVGLARQLNNRRVTRPGGGAGAACACVLRPIVRQSPGSLGSFTVISLHFTSLPLRPPSLATKADATDGETVL